jgi:recombination protein RecR
MKSVLPKAVRDLTYELTRLPSIGPKTAQRLAIYLLRQPEVTVNRLATTLRNLHASVYTCTTCFNLADHAVCTVCRDRTRNPKILCVVEDPLDVDSIERTGSYHGHYHVLGGVLSPLEGIGADQLTINELFERLQQAKIDELIIALDHKMESEATTRYILTRLPSPSFSITRLAQGLPTGGDIEFADVTTLTAAFQGRKKL